MKKNSQITPEVYQAATETAVAINRSNLGLLKITGQTRIDLIHRMSTQDLNQLQSGEGAATILTTDIGRIIDRLILYASSDTVYVLTGENNADNIARYLMRFVFFNDDFHLQDVSDTTAVTAIYGPQAKQKLVQAGFPDEELPLHHWREVDLNGVTAYFHRTDPIMGDGYFVMCETAVAPAIQQQLQSAGIVMADEPAFDYLRIASGQPRFGHELTQDYIPLEADLWADVSFTKGCYIGQEIIARMESRGKLAKRLVKLTLSAPAEAGAELMANGKKAGTLTSVANGLNGTIGLGYVKTSVLDAESNINIGTTAVALLPDPTPQTR